MEVHPVRPTAASGPKALRNAEEFTGTDRFEVRRRIGAGAFGVVYEAWDRRESTVVALKVLRFAEADALYRFKRGIRSLADIRHCNLIEFHGLEETDGWWILVMELVHGVDFVEFLRGTSWEALAGDAGATPVLGEGEGSQSSGGREDDGIVLDYDRVRSSVAQLARGLHTLHQNGRLHRDIKPPNIMVTGEGRVVLLDFGLVTELERWDLLESTDSSLVGTPAYMSPEQAEGGPPVAANDWYSVGVMLYQVLTGTLPFTGTLFQVMQAKLTRPAPDVRRIVSGVPEDLSGLCQGLLASKPEDRLTGEEVLGRLAAAVPPEEPSLVRSPIHPSSPFVGRAEALRSLFEALAASREHAVTVCVSGRSGMGKTALLRHFLGGLQDGGEAVLLEGRCYLRESVPYKAVDSLIDALSRYLMSLPRREAEALLPSNVVALARLFPVLRRVTAVAEAPGAVLDDSDPQGLRRRAFLALRELLRRLSLHRPLVLMIDDMQWGDVDSFHLLDEVLRPPDAPLVLMLGSYRSEDEATSPFLRTLRKQLGTHAERGGDVREIVLSELSDDEAGEIVRRLAAEGGGLDGERSSAIVREGGGSPLLLAELTRYSHERGVVPSGAAGGSGVALHELLRARFHQLAEVPRRLLEVVAVAGKPVDVTVAGAAAEVRSGLGAAIESLHASRLIRRAVSDEGDEVETYHDRIREVVVECLDAELLRSHHRRLAEALEAAGEADAETLAAHFAAHGDRARARAYVLAAAEQAELALAFEHAARLLRSALDLDEPFGPERYRLQVRLGRALASAGHSREAAEALIGAVEVSGTFDPFQVQRDAAEQLLVGGHIDRGLLVLRHVLRTVGMQLESSRLRAALELRWMRLRLWIHGRWLHGKWLRGRFYRERDEASCDPTLLKRIDVCWSVEIGLCLVDVLHASHFHAKNLLLSLSAGEPRRLARALSMEVFFGVMEKADPRLAYREARRLAGRLGDRHTMNLAEMAAGMRACVTGDWQEALRRLLDAEAHLREETAGVYWELDTVKHFRILAMLHLGQWAELFAELPQLVERAEVRGDRYLEIHLRQWVECRHLLARDEPGRAAEIAAEAIAGWSHQGFHFQHFGHLVAAVDIALYRGEGERALEFVEERWPLLKGSMIERLEIVRVLSYDLRARASLAAAASEADVRRRERLLLRVERDARRIEKSGSTWAEALAALHFAGAASVRGLESVAAARLERAENGFVAGDMRVLAAVARRRRGQCLEAADDIAEADRLLRGQGVERPGRLAAVYAPGSWRPEP